MIGDLISSNTWSSLKYNGAFPSSRFSETTEDNQLVLFEKQNNPSEYQKCSSVTISANATPVYFCVLRGDTDIDHDFTDDFVFFADAGKSMTVNGMSIKGIKINGITGTNYFIQGLGY